MSVVEEISKFILVLLVAILVLQIVTKGNGMNWIKSKFNVVDVSGATATTANSSGFGSSAGAGQGGGGGGGGSF